MFKRDQIKPMHRIQKRGLEYSFMKGLKKAGYREVMYRGEVYLELPK